MAGDGSTVGAEARRDGPRALSVVVSAALFVAALAQLGTFASRFLMPSWPQWSGPNDIEFQPITGVLAAVVAVGTLLGSRTARTIATGVGLGGFVGLALMPPWAILDTRNPVPALIGFLILALMGASLAAGFSEERISTGRNLLWQIAAGGGIGLAISYSVLVLMLVWTVLTASQITI